ncbi:MAG: hypothetical protein AAFP78_08465, partial [Pseudomonadota bacterium]
MKRAEPIKAVWRRLFRNIGLIFSGRVFFGLVNLAALAIVTRAVGAEAVGALGLLIAFSAAVSAGLSFQSWQTVLRYGAALRGDAPRRLSSLLGATLLADAAAAIATVAITFAFVGSLGSFLRMPGDIAAAAPWFAALHLFG